MSILAGAGTLIWQAHHSLRTAPSDSANIFLFPVWAYFSALGSLGLGAFIYFLRPSRTRLLAAAAGGLVWGIAAIGKWWLEHDLGWWHSRFQNNPDPLLMLSPATWPMFVLFGVIFMLL